MASNFSFNGDGLIPKENEVDYKYIIKNLKNPF